MNVSHGELDEGSRREVSNQVNVQDLEEFDSVVRGIFEAIYMFAEVIASFRLEKRQHNVTTPVDLRY